MIIKKIITRIYIVYLMAILFTFNTFIVQSADDIEQPSTPSLEIALDGGNPSMGKSDSEDNSYYVDLNWTADFPVGAEEKFINIYYSYDNKSYKASTGIETYETLVPADSGTYRVKGLESGNIYRFKIRSQYTTTTNGNTITSAESVYSNEIRVLTDINIAANALSSSEIKIKWDDVFYNNDRIDYKLYISENDSFSNVSPIYIDKDSQIGEDKPVLVNLAEGNLEYIYTVSEPSRIYYIKVEPDFNDDSVNRNTFSNMVSMSSMIHVRTTKISTMSLGVVWNLEWSPVVTGKNDSSIMITYDVYKVNVTTNDLPQKIATLNDTELPIIVETGEDGYYYNIHARVTQNGATIYNFTIKSDNVYVQESDVPSTPKVPELVELFERATGDVIIDTESNLTSESMVILWRAPYIKENVLDTDIKYDIWVLNDPNQIDDPPSSALKFSNFKPSGENYVENNSKIVGYKLTVDGLTQNSTYYLKIVAKKTFIEYVDDGVVNIDNSSDPALKIIITPAEIVLYNPLIPATPPFKIKSGISGKIYVGENNVTLQLRNMWYEQYNSQTEKWDYIRANKLNEFDIPPLDVQTSVIDDVYLRKVEYDQDTVIDIGVAKFQEGKNYAEYINEAAYRIKGILTQPNDEDEIKEYNSDNRNHNIDIDVNNLDENTTYIMWSRARRSSTGSASGVSNPLIITTLPKAPNIKVIPPVPFISYEYARDIEIDLGWDFKSKYSYNLKYAHIDSIENAGDVTKITYDEIKEKGVYSIKELNANTTYYFWIQAEYEGASGTISSDWSDSYLVKTKTLSPPNKPEGFGVQSLSDSIGIDYVWLEWISETDISYYIEISKSDTFIESIEYTAGITDSYQILELYPNTKYYARIYAYDVAKDLRSQASNLIYFVTKRSNTDFDTGFAEIIEDTNTYLETSFDEDSKRLTINILGDNAQRLLKKISRDKATEYEIELDSFEDNITNYELQISSNVFKGLTQIKENLIISYKNIRFILPPDILGEKLLEQNMTVDRSIFNIVVENEILETELPEGYVFEKNIGSFSIKVGDGNLSKTIYVTNKPVYIKYSFNDPDWYQRDTFIALVYDKSKRDWIKVPIEASYNEKRNQGEIYFKTNVMNNIIIATKEGRDMLDLSYHLYEKSIQNILKTYKIDSYNNGYFEPDAPITVSESIKILFKVLGYEIESDYLFKAMRAEIISQESVMNSMDLLTVREAILHAIKIYEINEGKSFSTLENKIKFGVENGLIIFGYSDIKKMDDVVTKGEYMNLLERALYFSGQLY